MAHFCKLHRTRFIERHEVSRNFSDLHPENLYCQDASTTRVKGKKREGEGEFALEKRSDLFPPAFQF